VSPDSSQQRRYCLRKRRSRFTGDVNNVDFVGWLLAERSKPGRTVRWGETATRKSFADPVSGDLRHGDRFYYENTMSDREFREMRKATNPRGPGPRISFERNTNLDFRLQRKRLLSSHLRIFGNDRCRETAVPRKPASPSLAQISIASGGGVAEPLIDQRGGPSAKMDLNAGVVITIPPFPRNRYLLAFSCKVCGFDSRFVASDSWLCRCSRDISVRGTLVETTP